MNLPKRIMPKGTYWNGERYVEPTDPSYDPRIGEWVTRNYENDKVRRWLTDNPPPPEWTGSAMEYAFTEMPFAPR